MNLTPTAAAHLAQLARTCTLSDDEVVAVIAIAIRHASPHKRKKAVHEYHIERAMEVVRIEWQQPKEQRNA